MIIKTNILTPVSRNKIDYKTNVFLKINGRKIYSISLEIDKKEEYSDYTNKICFPGFIDSHVHLSQFYSKGMYEPDLLKWLQKYIFDAENRSQDATFAKKISEDFFDDLLKHGTTTSVVYTAPFEKACDIAFDVANKKKVRSLIGMTLMDIDSPSYLQQNKIDALEGSKRLFYKWNGTNDLLEYIFTPRFAPVCSFDLMQEIGAFAKANNAYIQTHLSENLNEINVVKSKYKNFESYTEVYEKANLLSSKTLLGHCIHLDKSELEILQNYNAKIVHCPDSNFFLKSGIFPMNKVLESKLDFSLGSDMGAGTCSSMFYHMKMEIYRQNIANINPVNTFYDATLGAAKVLGKDHLIGSIEDGKEADLVFFDMGESKEKSGAEILSGFIFNKTDAVVTDLFIAGEKIL